MRLHLSTTPNSVLIPFTYQQNLTGVLHKWLGANNSEHGKISMYSFSKLNGSKLVSGGLSFQSGAAWFISFADDTKIKNIVASILNNPDMFCGMKVLSVDIEDTPDLSKKELFLSASPILIKRFSSGNKTEKHYTYLDSEAGQLLRETLIHKMQRYGLPKDNNLDINFDLSYTRRKTKIVTYKNIKNKVSVCPVIIKGKPETKAFA